MTDKKNFTIPLRDPKEFFDDWDDTNVDEAYFEEFIDKKIQELLNKGIINIDDVIYILANGIYVLPQRPGQPVFNIRALDEYVKERGIDHSSLTDEELEKFVTNWDELAELYKNGTLKISESLPHGCNESNPEEILNRLLEYINPERGGNHE